MLDSNEARQVYLLPSNDGSFQKWRLLDGDDEGYWSLVNVATGFALDGTRTGDVYTMGRNDGAFQRWRFHFPLGEVAASHNSAQVPAVQAATGSVPQVEISHGSDDDPDAPKVVINPHEDPPKVVINPHEDPPKHVWGLPDPDD